MAAGSHGRMPRDGSQVKTAAAKRRQQFMEGLTLGAFPSRKLNTNMLANCIYVLPIYRRKNLWCIGQDRRSMVRRYFTMSGQMDPSKKIFKRHLEHAKQHEHADAAEFLSNITG